MFNSKRIIHGACFLVLIAILAPLAVAAGGAEIQIKVTANSAVVRSRPEAQSPVLTSVIQGTTLTSPAKTGEWYQVALPLDPNGGLVEGYIHQSRVEVVGAARPSVKPKTEAPPVKAPPAPEKPPAPPVREAITEPSLEPEPPRYAPPLAGSAGLAFRPYFMGGLLLTPPSAADLGYLSASGTNLEQYLTTSTGNFGGGFQLLFAGARNPGLRFGMDVGFRKLLSATFDALGSNPPSFLYQDYHEESESDIHLLGLIEFQAPGSPFVLQGGLGGHFVLWNSRYIYDSKYQSSDETTSGMEFQFGMMAAAGLNLPAGERLTIPILLRLDYIMRYSGYLSASFVLGFSFH